MKKILLSLFWIITLWLINFSSAITYNFSNYDDSYILTYSNDNNSFDITFDSKFEWQYFCIQDYNWNSAWRIEFSFWSSQLNFNDPIYSNCFIIYWWTYNHVDLWGGAVKVVLLLDSDFIDNNLSSDCPVCPSCPSWSSQQCQSEYNLIPVSSIDNSYCENNNLCPLYTGWSCETWDNENWSALYINDIQHNSASVIDITIPEEISRDYINENGLFDLDIQWYNVDSEYIEWVINNQNYIPTSEDLSNVFSNLGLFWSLLVVWLFIILLFYMFKSVFK